MKRRRRRENNKTEEEEEGAEKGKMGIKNGGRKITKL